MVDLNYNFVNRVSSEAHFFVFSICFFIFEVVIFAEFFCQSDFISVISNFHEDLDFVILNSLNFDQAEIIIDNDITRGPKFRSDHRKPLVAKLQE